MDYARLSKLLSLILRHKPSDFGIELENGGWVNIEELIAAIIKKDDYWLDLREEDIKLILEKFDKERFELNGEKIRAIYGHTIPVKIERDAKEPPSVLYHGTARKLIKSIRIKGLLPQVRQYVHLSIDIDTAMQVGLRKDIKPVILKIRSLEAWNDGVMFYQGNEKVWLVESMECKYIDFY